jgi:hypothetical protein
VLRVGLDNYIDESTVTASVNTLGHTSDSVKDYTITNWVGVDACTLTVTWSSSKVIDLLTIHRIKIVTNCTITGKLSSSTVFSGVFTNTNLNGIDVKSLYTNLSGTIDELEFSFTGTGSPEIGYIFAGSKIDSDFEKIQLIDNVSDITNITLGGFASNSKRTAYRSMTLTINKKLFTTNRDFIRNIISYGLGIPRPWIVLASDCLVDDCMLGIMDAHKFQYDLFDVSPDRYSNITIGIQEVFGGV